MAGPPPRHASRCGARRCIARCPRRGIRNALGLPRPVEAHARPDRPRRPPRTRSLRRQNSHRGRRSGGIRCCPPIAGWCHRGRRHAARAGMAARMGLFTRGDHLRGHQRNPEGHRCHPIARIAQERVMADVLEATERDLMTQTLRRLAEELDGVELSKALADFGFVEVLAEAPREAVSTLFDALGRAGSTSSSLQDVLLQPLTNVLHGASTVHNVVLPSIGAALSGSLHGDAVTLRGLLIGHSTATAVLAPVAADDSIAWVSIADPSVLTKRVVAGLDPALAMTEVGATEVAATI